MFIDSNHAGSKETMRCMTGFMTYINMSLINFYSKNQYIIETPDFDEKFIAMKVRVETLHAI